MNTFVIAEAGVNHNGDIKLALDLIDVAESAGANAVKFQSFKAEELVTSAALKAPYQNDAVQGHETQFEMLRELELSEEDHFKLRDHADSRGVEFMSTAFDQESLAFLVNRVGIQRVKVPSGELTNGPLLLAIGRSKLPTIISTGMCDLADIERALGVIAFGRLASESEDASLSAFGKYFAEAMDLGVLGKDVSVLHCTTAYPTPLADVNLLAMDTIRDAFSLPVGLSDHTKGWNASLAAVARGATIIEKHFTLSRTLPGPDHQASLEPNELAEMITSIREVESAIGDGQKRAAQSEHQNLDAARRTLVASSPISTGQIFTDDNLTAKRAGTGLSPMSYWSLLGQRASRDYDVGEIIVEEVAP